MGFGFRVAPGVRIYPGGRGIGVGLRGGPLSYYTRAGGGSRSSVNAYQRQLRAAERAQEIEAVAAADNELVRIATVHEEQFPSAQPPEAAAAADVDSGSIRKRLQKEELKGVPLFGRNERREAKERARERAEAEAAEERERREDHRAEEQGELDKAWERLLANDPNTVLASLEEAFSDNETPSAAVSCRGGRVDILMRWFPIDEIVGERKFAYTPAGNPTHKKRSQKERNQLYFEAMASNALATAKEAFAVGPKLEECAVLCVRGEHDPAYGDTVLEVLYQGVLPRSELAAMNWPEVSPIAALAAMPEARLGIKGKSFQIRPVDVTDDPETVAFLAHLASKLNWRSPYGDAEPPSDGEAAGVLDLGDSDASLLDGLASACLGAVDVLVEQKGVARNDHLFALAPDSEGHRLVAASFDTTGKERLDEVAEFLAEQGARAAGLLAPIEEDRAVLYLCDRTGEERCEEIVVTDSAAWTGAKADHPPEAEAIRESLSEINQLTA